ncbi:Fc.00g075120.m01.CDS01 [Cosmosporella sp. VM-42]
MCGPENTNRPRGGALVALSPPITGPRGIFRGDLAFHAPGSPASTNATHARLTPSEVCDVRGLSDLYVVIHSSGDLTRNACDCGLFRGFAFPTAVRSDNEEYVEIPLDKPLSLEVGNEGIIGRRVSVFSRPPTGSEVVVAEGIVGFNFLGQDSPSLSPRSSPSPSPPPSRWL